MLVLLLFMCFMLVLKLPIISYCLLDGLLDCPYWLPVGPGSVNAPHSILCGGVNTLLGPMSYIGNCMAGMLSHVGRCWTFDRTADGYQEMKRRALNPKHSMAHIDAQEGS